MAVVMNIPASPINYVRLLRPSVSHCRPWPCAATPCYGQSYELCLAIARKRKQPPSLDRLTWLLKFHDDVQRELFLASPALATLVYGREKKENAPAKLQVLGLAGLASDQLSAELSRDRRIRSGTQKWCHRPKSEAFCAVLTHRA
jgi:hypothetical protein